MTPKSAMTMPLDWTQLLVTVGIETLACNRHACITNSDGPVG